jgi:type II secretory pathway component HofQ
MHRRGTGDRHDRGERRIVTRAILAVLTFVLAAPAGAATEKRLDVREGAARVSERTVTIDVKDAEARAILKDLQKQCGVKNLMIDPDVQGKGTFYFERVPCPQAWSIVLRSLGLDSQIYTNSVITVGAKKSR